MQNSCFSCYSISSQIDLLFHRFGFPVNNFNKAKEWICSVFRSCRNWSILSVSFLYTFIYHVSEIEERKVPHVAYNKHPTFICRNIYKLFASVNVADPGTNIPPVAAYCFICLSDYENLFCTNTTDANWKRVKCSIIDNRIECPLFKTYKTYPEFFMWKISTFAVKIAYNVSGKEYCTFDRPVTPYFKCSNIARIGPHDEMFIESDHKHGVDDCLH